MDSQTSELIKAMKAKLQEQDAILQRLTTPPHKFATVIRVGDTLTLFDGGLTDVERNPDYDLNFGDGVLINGIGQIAGLAPELPSFGTVAIVARVLDEHSSELTGEGQPRVVLNGKTKPKAKDRVLLDRSGIIIERILPQEDGNRYVNTSMVNVPWDSIGGQRVAKQALREAVEEPLKHPEVFAAYGKNFPSGILLYGPPGNGKTLLGKAVATSLNTSDGGAFFSLKGPEVLDPFVGEAERKIRNLFSGARAHKQRTGRPAVIFIDEAEALLSARGSGISSDMERTIVPTFLAEMDGMEESSAIVMLATNRPERLDQAIVRDGRMDRKIEIPRPDSGDASEILGIHLKGVPLAKKETTSTLAEVAVTEIFDGGHKVGRKALSDIVSGAMLKAVVDQAKSFALHRDLSGSGKPSGLGKEDIMSALHRIQTENRDISHAA